MSSSPSGCTLNNHHSCKCLLSLLDALVKMSRRDERRICAPRATKNINKHSKLSTSFTATSKPSRTDCGTVKSTKTESESKLYFSDEESLITAPSAESVVQKSAKKASSCKSVKKVPSSIVPPTVEAVKDAVRSRTKKEAKKDQQSNNSKSSKSSKSSKDSSRSKKNSQKGPKKSVRDTDLFDCNTDIPAGNLLPTPRVEVPSSSQIEKERNSDAHCEKCGKRKVKSEKNEKANPADSKNKRNQSSKDKPRRKVRDTDLFDCNTPLAAEHMSPSLTPIGPATYEFEPEETVINERSTRESQCTKKSKPEEKSGPGKETHYSLEYVKKSKRSSKIHESSKSIGNREVRKNKSKLGDGLMQNKCVD